MLAAARAAAGDCACDCQVCVSLIESCLRVPQWRDGELCGHVVNAGCRDDRRRGVMTPCGNLKWARRCFDYFVAHLVN